MPLDLVSGFSKMPSGIHLYSLDTSTIVFDHSENEKGASIIFPAPGGKDMPTSLSREKGCAARSLVLCRAQHAFRRLLS